LKEVIGLGTRLGFKVPPPGVKSWSTFFADGFLTNLGGSATASFGGSSDFDGLVATLRSLIVGSSTANTA